MQVKQTVGILFLLTAFVTGYWEFYLMVRPLIGGPWSWWYPIMFGASILLLVGAVLVLLPRMKSRWLVALAVAVPLILCSPFGVSWSCAIFVAAIGFATWGTLALASACKRPWVVPFTAGVVLAAWWIPASVHSVGTYLSPKPPSLDPMELAWALVPSVLVLASLIAAAILSRSPGPVAGG